MEENLFTATAEVLPHPLKQCNFTSVTGVLPANDLANRYFDCYFFLILPLVFADFLNPI